MNASFDPALIRLCKGAVRQHRGERGLGVAVFEGRVWLTQENDLRDVVLDAGDVFAFERSGSVVVEALSDTSLLVFDNRQGAAAVDRT